MQTSHASENGCLDNNDSHESHTDVPPDQAALLRALARDGTAGYNHDTEAMNGFSKGAHTMEELVCHAEDSPESHDLDPTALLEALANVEREAEAVGNEDPATSVSNDSFARLLQAAATAGDVATQGDGGFFRRSFTVEPREDGAATRPKRKCNEVDSEGCTYGIINAPGSKRRSPQPEQEGNPELSPRENETWEAADKEYGDYGVDEPLEHQKNKVSKAVARAIGVHSTAALFRRPTSNKYGRPQMAKLYAGLELDSEQFVHLQAGAKAFMLDEKYPERLDTVGARGKGDTDTTKLKLFSCVETFLEEDGWGERLFGASSPRAEHRKLIWPQMRIEVITQVAPLMRRMVKNERQRLYAVESRKEKRKGSTANAKSNTHRSDSLVASTPSPLHSQHQALPSHPNNDDLDSHLSQSHYNIETERWDHASNTNLKGQFSTSDLQYHVNIVDNNGCRIQPRFTLTPKSCPGFSSLVQYIHNSIDDLRRHELKGIEVLGPSGLVHVDDERSWREAIRLIVDEEWMDSDVRCVVRAEDRPLSFRAQSATESS